MSLILFLFWVSIIWMSSWIRLFLTCLILLCTFIVNGFESATYHISSITKQSIFFLNFRPLTFSISFVMPFSSFTHSFSNFFMKLLAFASFLQSYVCPIKDINILSYAGEYKNCNFIFL